MKVCLSCTKIFDDLWHSLIRNSRQMHEKKSHVTTNAFGDPDLALKVKERTPRTLDEALRIALRLEAWAKIAKQEKQKKNE